MDSRQVFKKRLSAEGLLLYLFGQDKKKILSYCIMLSRLSLFRHAFCPAFRARRWLSRRAPRRDWPAKTSAFAGYRGVGQREHALGTNSGRRRTWSWRRRTWSWRTTGWRRHWRKRPTSWPWYSWMLSTSPCALFWSSFWKSAWRSLSIATACLRGIRSYWKATVCRP